MNRTGKIITYVTGISAIVVLLLCWRLFENEKLIIPAIAVAVILLFLSISNSAEKDKNEKDYHVSESLKRASQEVKDVNDDGKVVNESKRIHDDIKPVRCEEQIVFFNVDSINRILMRNDVFKTKQAIHLKEDSPIIRFCEFGAITQEYCLQCEKGESFKDKYFRFTLSVYSEKENLVALCEGYISNTREGGRTPENEKIIYRFEKHYLETKSKNSAASLYKKNDGKDLEAKGLNFPGFVNKENVRCVGICQKCNKSFAFRTYRFKAAFSEPVYSDDGLDVYELREELSDGANVPNRSWQVAGKTFRYYNSFRCPHCGGAYIDYDRHNSMKRFGNLACVHLGHKIYTD